jgi:NADPH:quinone reductase-like Zn-dependent oxidoreductase
MAVQLARHRGVQSSCGFAWKHRGRSFVGNDEVIDYTSTRFEDAAGRRDAVFATAGGERLQRSPAVLRDGGRPVSGASQAPDGGVYLVVKVAA